MILKPLVAFKCLLPIITYIDNDKLLEGFNSSLELIVTEHRRYPNLNMSLKATEEKEKVPLKRKRNKMQFKAISFALVEFYM